MKKQNKNISPEKEPSDKEIELFIERLAEVLIDNVKAVEMQANSNKG